MRFLIDECLTTRLVGIANAAGYEASHVAWMGMSGASDWVIGKFAENNGWVVVTRNCVDFRGPASSPGGKGVYAHLNPHEGLICLSGPDGLDGKLQAELFCVALDMIAQLRDITNLAIEVSLADVKDDHATVAVYPVPKDGPNSEPHGFVKTVNISIYQDDVVITPIGTPLQN